jgi:hypothetical protein
METREPDWNRIYAIGEEVERLIAEGRWTREEFERLWRDLEAAAGSFEEAVEMLVIDAEPEWLQPENESMA